MHCVRDGSKFHCTLRFYANYNIIVTKENWSYTLNADNSAKKRRKLSLDRSHISNVESKKKNLTFSTITKLMRVSVVSVDELLKQDMHNYTKKLKWKRKFF